MNWITARSQRNLRDRSSELAVILQTVEQLENRGVSLEQLAATPAQAPA